MSDGMKHTSIRIDEGVYREAQEHIEESEDFNSFSALIEKVVSLYLGTQDNSNIPNTQNNIMDVIELSQKLVEDAEELSDIANTLKHDPDFQE